MNKDTITLRVAGQESMRIEAYISDLCPGLAIHRQVVWVPAKGEHKFTSKWTITHIPSGHTLLRPSEALETMTQAHAVVKGLEKFTWDDEDPSVQSGAKEALAKALDDVREGSYQEKETEVPERSSRFVVRRNDEGPGYRVVDTATEQTVETFMHRGMASSFAKEQNAKASL